MSDLQTAYKRDLRDQWRAGGGSSRRPLRSFMTAEDKAARRLEHAERLNRCREWLETREGIAEWLISRELNPDISPLNQALAAYQAPREIVGTVAFWKRQGVAIRRGESGTLYLTAPGFWPKPAFTAAQTHAGPELVEVEPGVPDPAAVDSLRSVYADACDSVGRKPAMARLLETLPIVGDIEFQDDATPARSDDIPF